MPTISHSTSLRSNPWLWSYKLKHLMKTGDAYFVRLVRLTSKEKFGGPVLVIVSSALSAIMGIAFYTAHTWDPNFSSLGGSFVRVLVNLLLIFVFMSSNERPELLSPLRHKALWLWGLFGALTVATFFSSIHLVGSGLASLLCASSGIFIAALAPLLARQRVGWFSWIAIAGSLLGMCLLTPIDVGSPSLLFFNSSQLTGLFLASLSGLFCGLAYLMIARTGGKYSMTNVMFTWCLASIALHIGIFFFVSIHWPQTPKIWLLLLGAGVIATISQRMMTKAFQIAPAAKVAAISYLGPVLNLVFDSVLFDMNPSLQQKTGALIIVACGVGLPLLSQERLKTQ